jgi:hypothetical protein
MALSCAQLRSELSPDCPRPRERAGKPLHYEAVTAVRREAVDEDADREDGQDQTENAAIDCSPPTMSTTQPQVSGR